MSTVECRGYIYCILFTGRMSAVEVACTLYVQEEMSTVEKTCTLYV